MPLSDAFPFEDRYVDVHGSRMRYVEKGEGDPILFIHGNPTSAYLWRNVIPYVTPHGRAVAVDLIGMGKSDKPDLEYRFFDHYRYVEGFIEALGLENVTLVLHDWGGGLGLSYARRHESNVRGIALMEAVTRPVRWKEMNPLLRMLFKRMRDPVKGDRMNMEKAFFLRRLLPNMVVRRLTHAEKIAYWSPYPTPQSRKPVAQWPREIPIDGEPADVHEEIEANYEWFRHAELPKLFLNVKPGAIWPPKAVEDLSAQVDGLETVFVGKGRHYIQEDVPDEIGGAIQAWLR